LNSYDVFGETTFNSIFVTEKWHNQYPQAYATMVQQFDRAETFINAHPHQAAQLLSKYSKGKQTADEIYKDMTAKGIKYTSVPNGFMKVATFMKQVGLISKAPSSWKDLVFSNLDSTKGS
ncbi:MAG: hypothetical protein ACYDAG_09215, partial [Chloroflexota bacterium]